MKKILLTVLFTFLSVANALNIGDKVPSFQIKDQFDKKHSIKADTKLIVVAGDMDASDVLKEYLKAKPKGFLESKKAYYIADISGMPSLISKFFALPKMKKYPFSILLVDEEQVKSFDKKDENITVYIIKDGKVSDKKYIKTAKELDEVFK